MRLFDRKFGADFLRGVPTAPGVYRLYDESGALLYVGKATSLRRRLGQYRTAGRKKRERKRRALVKAAFRITWEVSDSPLTAALMEIRLIQALRPRRNVASAFAFLYPFVGIRVDGAETYFCLTTSPAAFPAFELHGAFRSREVTGEAFFSLMRLLRYVGHPVPRHRCRRLGAAPHSHVLGLRRLPRETVDGLRRLLRGESRDALEALTLELLEHAAARARASEIRGDLLAADRFFEEEACALARVITATGHAGYPVAQRERDLLFATYREAVSPSPEPSPRGGDPPSAPDEQEDS
ncbi:MAG TPA: GIY-YIG nuclease family protein [Candidatus Bathyarchaeia archaeon]|nr:GIY-YIG nuclease family protein [Candidatus Bathyarchaeia archaeon]